MEWCVLQPKKNHTSSAAALPHTQKCNLVFLTLLNICCWQYWRSLCLQAMGQCGAAFLYFVPQAHFSNKFSYPFLLSPHFFCMRPLCTDSFRPCFSLPCWFMYDTQCPLFAILASGYLPHWEDQEPAWQWCSVSSDSGDLFPFLLTALAS